MSKVRDIETSAAIKLALMTNAHIGGMDINVKTVNGIVFLRGFVLDRSQRNLAEIIARDYGGIDIRNDIEVMSESREASPLHEAQSGEADDQVVRGHVAGNLESDSRVNISMINVDVANGVVRLTGIQDSDGARNRAEQIARRVDGVQEVINDIEVSDRAA